MAFAPRTVQNMPDCLQREPTMVLQPASMTPAACKKRRSAELWEIACVRHFCQSSPPRCGACLQQFR